MTNWWESNDAESFGYEELDSLKKEIFLTNDHIKEDFYVDWGDITDLGKRIIVNSYSGDMDFTITDYGIYEFKDIPCSFGLQSYIPNLTRVSTASIERLIEELIFLPFEYGQN